MSKPFKIVLIVVALLVLLGIAYGAYVDGRGGSDKTREGIDSIDAELERLENFKK